MRNIRNCTVAVVGGAGFLGSHLTNHLIEDRGCDVRVIDNLVVGRREWVHPKAAFFHANITDSEAYLKYLFSFGGGCQFVFNYAAHPYIPLSFVRPLHVFETNATGAIKVINAAQDAGVEAILQVSSAELYGDGFKGLENYYETKLDELAPVTPHSTYGAAKAAVDYYCQVAWRERRTPVIALRQFNCVGERDQLHPYVIPEVVRQLIEHPPKVCLGNNSTRDFLYAGDAVRMAVELLEKGQMGDVYNIGSESSIKIFDLAQLIGQLMGYDEVEIIQEESRKRPWEIWSLQSDNGKAYSAGVSKPLVSLKDALQLTIDDLVSAYEKGQWK